MLREPQRQAVQRQAARPGFEQAEQVRAVWQATGRRAGWKLLRDAMILQVAPVRVRKVRQALQTRERRQTQQVSLQELTDLQRAQGQAQQFLAAPA